MKIQVFSDTHCFGSYIPPVTDSDVLVCLGDIDAGLKIGEWLSNLKNIHQKPIIFVPGNHDFYLNKTFEEWESFYSALFLNDVYVLQNQTVEINGYFFIGSTLWSDCRGDEVAKNAIRTSDIKDFSYIKRINNHPFSVDDASRLYNDSVNYIDKMMNRLDDKKVILLTHFCPVRQGTDKYPDHNLLTYYYSSNLDNKIVMNWNPLLCCYGHTHDSYDFMLGDTRFICNPQGSHKSKNKSFTEDLVIEV